MKVIWAHNFDPETQNSGVFMHTLLRGVTDLGVHPQLLYLGNLRTVTGIARAPFALRHAARGADLVHAQFGSACALVASMVPGKKVVSLRGSDWYRLKDGPLRSRFHGVLATGMTRISVGRFDGIVVMSEHMRCGVQSWLSDSRIAVIPDGVDLDLFKPLERRTAKDRLGFPADQSPWVLFPTVATSNPVKRPALAEQAVEFARQFVPDIQLRVATGVPHASMPLLMNAASVVLMTSVHEGWPNSIKEGLACNTPFVSTNVSDLERIAEVEPSCSVEPPDAAALGAALVRAIRAPRSETLRDRVAWMDHRRCAARLLEMYETTLA